MGHRPYASGDSAGNPWAEPGDIAETAHFLASPGARQITGQTIHVNGGAFTTR